MKTLQACTLALMYMFGLQQSADADLFGPDNYDECIADSMKGVTNDVAARAIIMSCRKQFPVQGNRTATTTALSQVQLEKLDGRADISGSYFKGDIYNGNSDISLVEVTIALTSSFDGKEVTREYIDNVSIEPLSAGGFMFECLESQTGSITSWYISAAKGSSE